MRYLFSIILVLLCSTAWAFPPGFIGAITGGAVTAPSGYSDSFTGADSTALATHDANWGDAGSSYPVTGAVLSGGVVQGTSGWAQGGGRYTASTSDTSQIVFKARTSGANPYNNCVVVRASSSSSGYAGCLGASGDNYVSVFVQKNGSNLGSTSSGASITVPQTVDRTVKIVATGTSTVTLEVFIDGTSYGTLTDSSSPITSGNPGFKFLGDGTLADLRFDNWQDS